MIDLKTEMENLEVDRMVEEELQKQCFIEVCERTDLGIGKNGRIPCKCGIYFIYRKMANLHNQEEWTLRYIGVHTSIRQRLSEHLFYDPKSKTKHKAYQIDKQSEFKYAVKYVLIEPRALKEYIEHVMIDKKNPPDNRHG